MDFIHTIFAPNELIAVTDWLDYKPLFGVFVGVLVLRWTLGLWLYILDYFSFTTLLVFVVAGYCARWYLRRAPAPSAEREFSLSSEMFGKGPDGKVIECKDPATGEVIKEVYSYTPDEVEKVLTLARAAQVEWSRTSFAERRAVLEEVMRLVLEKEEEICKASIVDSGKTPMEAMYGEILTTCEKLRWLIANGEKALRPQSRTPPLMLWFVKRAWVEWHPLGVIGIIVPWNYPFHNVASAVSAALFAGNAAVVKVSECATGSKDLFESLFRQALARRGHNPELVTLMAGYGETGAALCKSPNVDFIHFIGSTVTGRHVARAAVEHLTPTCLELGGKDPFIVLDDADLTQAVDVAVRGVFVNLGMNCIAAERVYVHERVFDRFKALIVPRVEALRVGHLAQAAGGHTYDCGCITMPLQYSKVRELIEDAVAKGAQLDAGGAALDAALPEKGLFIRPTILTGVTPEMRVAQEETFGPIMLLFPFKSEDEVVAAANSSQFGLGSSVFSRDRARAEALGRRLRCGMTTINDFGLGYLIQDLPFGGVGESGNLTKFNGPEGLRAFSFQKSVVSDRFSAISAVPNCVNYPVPPQAKQIVHHAVRIIYSPSWMEAFSSLRALIPLLQQTEAKKPAESKKTI